MENQIAHPTICINCKNYLFTYGYYNQLDDQGVPDKHQCKMPTHLNYITGEQLYEFTDCTKKNTTGNCKDYVSKS